MFKTLTQYLLQFQKAQLVSLMAPKRRVGAYLETATHQVSVGQAGFYKVHQVFQDAGRYRLEIFTVPERSPTNCQG